jgi:hypothetical protein
MASEKKSRREQFPVVLHKETKLDLIALKNHPRETFDDVIRRLIGKNAPKKSSE